MSNIWARSPDLFIYTKGNQVYLWRCNKTTWMPMIGQDFDVVAQITDHQALMGEDSLFDWDEKYYDDMISYISPRRLLVNNRGLVIVELRKFGQDGKLDENDQVPFYVRSFDVMSLKPYNLRDRTIPSRTVRYLGREGKAAPVEDSTASFSGNTTTSTTTSDDQKKWDEKREALEKQVTELTDANKTLKNDNIELRDANKTLKSEKEAAEKQASDLNDRNKTILAEDIAAQKTAAEIALQERDDAKRDKEAAERKAVELQTQTDNKKEGWMNDLSDSGWSRAEDLQPYIHHDVSGGYSTFRIVVVGEPGTLTVEDSTTNVRASYLYGVKIIDHDGDFDINLQRATKEYKAVKLEDLNPSKEKARFSGSNWVRELFLYTKGNDVYLWKCNTETLMPMITSDFDDLGKVMDHLDLIGGRDAVFDWERSYYNDLVAYISSRRLLVNNRGLVIAELQIFGQDGKMDESELPFYIRSLDVLSLKPFGLKDRTIPSRTVRYLERDGRAAPVEESITTTATTSTELDDENRAGLLKQVAELIAVNKILENDKEAANKQVTELKDANKTLKSEKEAAEKQLTELKDVAAQITAAEKAQQERDEAKRDKEAAERKVVELQTQVDNKKEVWMNDLSDSGWSTTESLAPYTYNFLVTSSGITTFGLNFAAKRVPFTVDDNTTNVRASFLHRIKILDFDGDRAVFLRARYNPYKAVKLEELSPNKEKARFNSSWVCCKYNGDTYVIKKEM